MDALAQQLQGSLTLSAPSSSGYAASRTGTAVEPAVGRLNAGKLAVVRPVSQMLVVLQ